MMHFRVEGRSLKCLKESGKGEINFLRRLPLPSHTKGVLLEWAKNFIGDFGFVFVLLGVLWVVKQKIFLLFFGPFPKDEKIGTDFTRWRMGVKNGILKSRDNYSRGKE